MSGRHLPHAPDSRQRRLKGPSQALCAGSFRCGRMPHASLAAAPASPLELADTNQQRRKRRGSEPARACPVRGPPSSIPPTTWFGVFDQSTLSPSAPSPPHLRMELANQLLSGEPSRPRPRAASHSLQRCMRGTCSGPETVCAKCFAPRMEPSVVLPAFAARPHGLSPTRRSAPAGFVTRPLPVTCLPACRTRQQFEAVAWHAATTQTQVHIAHAT